MGLINFLAALILIRHWAASASPLPRPLPVSVGSLPLALDGGNYDIDRDITTSTSTGTLPTSPIAVTTTSTTVLITVTANPTASTTLASALTTSTMDALHGPGFHKFNHTRSSYLDSASASATATSLAWTPPPFATAWATLIPVYLPTMKAAIPTGVPVHPAGYYHIDAAHAPHYDDLDVLRMAVSEDVTASLTATAEAPKRSGVDAVGAGPVVGMDVDVSEVKVPTIIGDVTVPDPGMDVTEVKVPTLIGDVVVPGAPN